MSLWHCEDRLSGERFEVHGGSEDEVGAAVLSYIRDGIDADTGAVAYSVVAEAIDGSTYIYDGEAEPMSDDE